jgi:transcriptional regulator with XRE-family HTH domain
MILFNTYDYPKDRLVWLYSFMNPNRSLQEVADRFGLSYNAAGAYRRSVRKHKIEILEWYRGKIDLEIQQVSWQIQQIGLSEHPEDHKNDELELIRMLDELQQEKKRIPKISY